MKININSRILTMVAALLVLSAMVMHIVCIATANLAEMDVQAFFDDFNKTVQEKEQAGWSEETLAELRNVEKIDKVLLAKGASMTYGLFKMCAEVTFMRTFTAESCVSWDHGDSSKFDSPGWLKGVAGCYVIGLILVAASVIICNTILQTESRDWRFNLHKIVCGTCLVAAIAILIGNFVLLGNYKSFSLMNIIDTNIHKDVYYAVTGIMYKQISLSWAFTVDIFSAVFLFVASALSFQVSRDVEVNKESMHGHKNLQQQFSRIHRQNPDAAM